MASGRYDFVVVANRLPVDRVTSDDGSTSWRRSPGGLVSALEPVMRHADGAWVGWSGSPDDDLEPFDEAGMHLVPVSLSGEEVEEFYEGFSNATLWPLYHDVIARPEFHREWWDTYVRVNQRFADAAVAEAEEGATVWVQDYQLQLVPAMLRQQREDLLIGFFNHIPFPPFELYSQLPWRRQVLQGLLGADLIGFQRTSDANNFLRACRRLLNLTSRRQQLQITDESGQERTVAARGFPISIDAASLDEMAHKESVVARAAEIRSELGDPTTIVLGVDRLDYTKGITHRIEAFGELLADGAIDPADVRLVQVATPSRERVEEYRLLRDEIEQTVGRINGDHATLDHTPVHYLHTSQPREELVALFLAADVMLVTSLRDGMNLVAKEYVAARHDERGVLVLSEFTGAADEMSAHALMVNPHDIDGMKQATLTAMQMDAASQRRRMRALRRRVLEHDVERWASDFLQSLQHPEGDE